MFLLNPLATADLILIIEDLHNDIERCSIIGNEKLHVIFMTRRRNSNSENNPTNLSNWDLNEKHPIKSHVT